MFDREKQGAYALEVEARDGAPSARPNSNGQPNSGKWIFSYGILNAPLRGQATSTYICYENIGRFHEIESSWKERGRANQCKFKSKYAIVFSYAKLGRASIVFPLETCLHTWCNEYDRFGNLLDGKKNRDADWKCELGKKLSIEMKIEGIGYSRNVLLLVRALILVGILRIFLGGKSVVNRNYYYDVLSGDQFSGILLFWNRQRIMVWWCDSLESS